MKKKKERENLKEKFKLVNIMNNDSMKLFSMLSLYFLLVLVIYTLFQFISYWSDTASSIALLTTTLSLRRDVPLEQLCLTLHFFSLQTV